MVNRQNKMAKFNFPSLCTREGFRAQGNEYSHAADDIPATNAILMKSQSSEKPDFLFQYISFVASQVKEETGR